MCEIAAEPLPLVMVDPWEALRDEYISIPPRVSSPSLIVVT